MEIYYHEKFRKNYRKRILANKKLVIQVKTRVQLFIKNPFLNILKNHALKGKRKKLRSFSITSDIRIIYKKISKDKIIFIDIGRHNQIY